jgi:Ca2+/H+ antiporter
MITLLKEIRHNPLLWLLSFVPIVFIAGKAWPEAHTLLFVLSICAIVPLAALLSHATESVAAKTGDAVGGLLNATLGNLTELVIALAALRAGQIMLVKASAFSGARKNRLDLSVGIALGSAAQIALFVAPVLVLLSYFIGPAPMDLRFWPGAVVMMLIAALTASLVTNSGRSAWFVGALVLMVYLIFRPYALFAAAWLPLIGCPKVPWRSAVGFGSLHQ